MDSVTDKDAQDYFADAQLVFQAGGKGERVGDSLPKQLMPVAGRPLIDWVIATYLKKGLPKRQELYVAVWHKPDLTIRRCEEISRYTGIKFHYLKEPKNQRLGRAGILIKSLNEGSLDDRKPIFSIQTSDINSYNPVDFSRFALTSLKKHGCCVSMLVSNKEQSFFGHIKIHPKTKVIKDFELMPKVRLPEGEVVNTGVSILNPKFYPILESVKEYPADLEELFDRKGALYPHINLISVFEGVEADSSWVTFKVKKDFADNDKRDMRGLLGIEDVENLLGPYKPGKK